MMPRVTQRVTASVLAIAALLCGAAAAPSVPPAAALQLAIARAHALHLARAWDTSHPGQARPNDSQPAIISGKIVTASVDVQQPPAAATLSFKFSTGSAGFDNAFFQFFNSTTNQSFTIFASASNAPVSGSLTIQNPGSVNQYAGPGNYTLDSAGIGDTAGNFVFYSSTQLAAIFPSLTVNVTNNGMPDTTIPSLLSGKLRTKTVSLSSARPIFLADVKVSDTISGVEQVFIVVGDPNGTPYTTETTSPSPVISAASVPVGLNFTQYGGTSLPTGTWTINEVFVTDVAGNSLEIGGAPDIQKIFGTNTFQVTD